MNRLKNFVPNQNIRSKGCIRSRYSARLSNRLTDLKSHLRPCIAIFIIMLQCLVVSVVNMLVAISSQIHPLEIALTRVVIHFTLSLPFMLYYNMRGFCPGSRILSILVLIRSISSTGSILAQTFAFAYATSMSNVQTLTATAPIYVVFLGALLLREKVRLADLFLLAVAVAGIVMIVKPSFIFGLAPTSTTSALTGTTIHSGIHSVVDKNDTIGYGCAMLTAIFAAVSMVTTRRVSFGMSRRRDTKRRGKDPVPVNDPLDLMSAETDAVEIETPATMADGGDKDVVLRVPFHQILFYTSSFAIIVISAATFAFRINTYRHTIKSDRFLPEKSRVYPTAHNLSIPSPPHTRSQYYSPNSTLSLPTSDDASTSSPSDMSRLDLNSVSECLRLFFSIVAPSIPCHGPDKYYVLASSFLSAVGQYLLYLGLRYEKAGITAIYRTAGVSITFLLDLIILHNLPPWNSWVGASLVTLGITVLAVRHYRLKGKDSATYNKKNSDIGLLESVVQLSSVKNNLDMRHRG